MIKKERDTVGKLSSELLQADTYADHSAGEQMQKQLKDYEKNLLERVDHGKTFYPADFYLVVIFKRDKLMPNVFNAKYFHRWTCPTPDYDQVAYKYHRKDDRIEFLWVIPDKKSIKEIYDNRLVIDLSVNQLISYVLEFIDGTLDKKCRSMNGEPMLGITPVEL